jgi:hypothetical protein
MAPRGQIQASHCDLLERKAHSRSKHRLPLVNLIHCSPNSDDDTEPLNLGRFAGSGNYKTYKTGFCRF